MICFSEFIGRLGILVLLVLARVPPGAAQSLTGSMEGRISDVSGAVIPGAAITATHWSTNTVYSAATNHVGRFRIPNVRLGSYEIEAVADGFSRSVVSGVVVEVGSTAAVNLVLEVGDVTTEVTVTAEAAQSLLNASDAEIGTVVDPRQVLELPLNGRNAVELAMQQAGVNFERSPSGEGEKFFINGQRHRSVNFTLDGVDTQDNLNRSSATIIDQPLLAMSAENVQEFRVVTGLSSAEHSRGGAQISAVTRSGGNELHGSLFNFHRNTALNANEFFNNSSGVERSPLVRNQFGGRVGGPLINNKTFFFFGYQQTRQAQGIPVNRTVYTSEARQGIFRFLDGSPNSPAAVAANPDAVRSVNLLECSPGVAAAFGRACLDGRFDGAARPTLDPFITGEIFGAMPLPNNFDNGDGLNTGGFRFNASSKVVEHLPSARIDHQISTKHLFFGTMNYTDRDIQGDFINGREPIFPALQALGARATLSKSFSATLISTFSPTFFNELRVGRLAGENGFPRNQPFGTPFQLDLNTIDDPYDPGGGTTARDNIFYHVRDTLSWIRGRHQLKSGFEWRRRTVDVYSFFGVAPEIELDDNDYQPGWSSTALGTLGGGSVNTVDRELARDLMNNVVGAVETVIQFFNVASLDSGFVPGIPERRIYRNWEFDWFLNDSWAVRPGLTANLGLRWEYSSPATEANGLLLMPDFDAVYGVSGERGLFRPGILEGSPCPQLGSTIANPGAADAVALINDCATTYAPAGKDVGRPLWNADKNNFAPVLSIAWDPFGDGKTSIRAGFRVSYFQDAFSIVDGNLDDNEGLIVRQSCIPSNGECVGNPGGLSLLRDLGPAGAGPEAPQFSLPGSRSILDTSAIDFRTIQPDLETPYYSEWTVGVSREIAPNLAMEVRWLGNRGYKLRRVAEFNEVNIFAEDGETGQTFLESFQLAQSNLDCNRMTGNASAGFSDASGAGCITPNPLMARLISGDAARLDSRTTLLDALDFGEPGEFAYRLTQSEVSRVNGSGGRIRGGSFWGQVLQGNIPVNFFQANPFVAGSRGLINDGFSTYNSLQVELRKRFSDGLQVDGNYTFGKAISDFDGDSNTLLNDRPSSIRNARYTTGQFMPRHAIKVNYIYELPIGAGKAWDPGGAAKLLLAGWQMGGLLDFRTGRPLSVVSNRGAFHRSAISDGNTVDLATPVSNGDLQGMTGVQNLEGRVIFIDPCMSAILGQECSTSNSIQGLFEQPATGTLGELPQTPFFGPARFFFDFILMKRFAVTETTNFEFRGEVFNLFNNANFALPESNIYESNFGQIARTVHNPRLIQFALKLNF